ncbi:MFS transporter [Novosphingobium panipatense]|uniref:MFS transporter n=1 Tax=Novosphingobium panipatense TaxID=428991 RepID=UPI0024B64CB1|nr:MFS transporter [Novosphingobium panipatense]
MDPAASYPPHKTARWAIMVLSVLGFFLSMDVTLTTLLIEPMKHDMVLTDVEIGLLQGTAFGLAFGLASLPLGRAIDRANRVTLLKLGLIVWMVSMGATALAGSVATLMLSRIALGFVYALLIPSALSIISDLYPPERRSVATSLFAVGQASGQAFGILAGG